MREGGLTFESRTKATLLGLGFSEEELKLSDGDPIYVYSCTGTNDISMYWKKLLSLGWELLEEDDPDTSDVFEGFWYKGNSFAQIFIYIERNEVWIAPGVFKN